MELEELGMRMALKLGRFFGNGIELWMNMQTVYDQWSVQHHPEALDEASRVEPATFASA